MTHFERASTPDGAVAYAGPLFRGIDARFQNDPYSGRGGLFAPGRFNRQGTEVLYLSLRPETAIFELSQTGLLSAPYTFVQFDVRLDGLCDLVDPGTLLRFGVTEGDLARDDYADLNDLEARDSPAQALAARLRAEGFRGLVARSYATRATPDCRNVVLFDWTPGDDVTLVDPHGTLTG